MTFTWSRLCITCRRSFPEPDDEGWTTLSLGEFSYWRCPECSESGAGFEHELRQDVP